MGTSPITRHHPRATSIVAGSLIRALAGFPEETRQIVLQHHEHLDGSRYPQGLLGRAICRGAAMLAVADVADAMGSVRPYRPALGSELDVAELRRGRGTLSEPDAVHAYIRLIGQDTAVERECGLIA